MVKPAVVKVVSRHAWRDAGQPFRLLGGREQLRHALVGEAIHAKAAIRFGASAKPADRLGSIVAFKSERIEVAFGIAPAADILNYYIIAMPREPNRVCIDNSGRDGAPVGLAH